MSALTSASLRPLGPPVPKRVRPGQPHHGLAAGAPAARSSVRRVSVASDSGIAATSMTESDLKMQILQHSATVDRGQLHDRLVSDAYEGKRQQLRSIIAELCKMQEGKTFEEAELEGEWELVYSTCQLFRSSPFFMAIQAAFNDTEKSSLFFKLHDLQVKSWGTSTVGRVGQRIDFGTAEMKSEFDTIIFGLTVIPIIGWFKLLPTFGGRVISFASDLTLDPSSGRMDMELIRTRVEEAPGIPSIKGIPLLGNILMDTNFPVKQVWKLLPWNRGRSPKCSVTVRYVDDTWRVMEDPDGEIFVYSRPLSTPVQD